MSDELKTCAHCGAAMSGTVDYWTHPENDCIFSGHEFDGHAGQAEKWNRRAPAAPAVQEPMNCREAGPGKGLCIECANGRYERCRYVVPRYAAPVPAIPPGYALVPIELLRQLRHYTICHLMNFPNCGAPTEAEIDGELAAAPPSPAPQDVKPKRKLDQDAAWRIAQHANYLALPSEFPSVQIMMTLHDLVRFFEIACKDYAPQDATDAQRYRFLRNPLNDVEGISSICAGDAMDDAIDAAIAAQDAGNGETK